MKLLLILKQIVPFWSVVALVHLSDRLRQPRNTFEWIVSALFGIVVPVALVPILTTNMVSGGLSTSTRQSVLQDQCCKSLSSLSVESLKLYVGGRVLILRHSTVKLCRGGSGHPQEQYTEAMWGWESGHPQAQYSEAMWGWESGHPQAQHSEAMWGWESTQSSGTTQWSYVRVGECLPLGAALWSYVGVGVLILSCSTVKVCGGGIVPTIRHSTVKLCGGGRVPVLSCSTEKLCQGRRVLILRHSTVKLCQGGRVSILMHSTVKLCGRESAYHQAQHSEAMWWWESGHLQAQHNEGMSGWESAYHQVQHCEAMWGGRVLILSCSTVKLCGGGRVPIFSRSTVKLCGGGRVLILKHSTVKLFTISSHGLNKIIKVNVIALRPNGQNYLTVHRIHVRLIWLNTDYGPPKKTRKTKHLIYDRFNSVWISSGSKCDKTFFWMCYYPLWCNSCCGDQKKKKKNVRLICLDNMKQLPCILSEYWPKQNLNRLAGQVDRHGRKQYSSSQNLAEG